MSTSPGSKIRGFALQNANHFWNKCKSLGQLLRNIFGSLRISLGRLQITFANGFAKRPFLKKFYAIRSNSAKKM